MLLLLLLLLLAWQKLPGENGMYCFGCGVQGGDALVCAGGDGSDMQDGVGDSDGVVAAAVLLGDSRNASGAPGYAAAGRTTGAGCFLGVWSGKGGQDMAVRLFFCKWRSLLVVTYLCWSCKLLLGKMSFCKVVGQRWQTGASCMLRKREEMLCVCLDDDSSCLAQRYPQNECAVGSFAHMQTVRESDIYREV